MIEQIGHIPKIRYFVAFSKAEAQTSTWKDHMERLLRGRFPYSPVAEYVQPVKADKHLPLAETTLMYTWVVSSTRYYRPWA